MTLNDLMFLLNDKGVPFKVGSNPYEIAINCPRCRDTKYHLQLNPYTIKHDIQGWGFCYKSWHAMPLAYVLKVLGIKVKDLFDAPKVKTTFDNFLNKMWALKNEPLNSSSDVIDYPEIDLGAFLPVIPATGWSSGRVLNYMKSRGFEEDQVLQYQIMCDPLGDYINRVIVPFFENHRPVYFQARDITGRADKKILNPTHTTDGGGKSAFLFNIDIAKDYDSVTICEGWASAISAGYEAVAISGKVASSRQLKLLKAHWHHYVIMLDPDALKEAINLACQLLDGVRKVELVMLTDGDPNEHSKEDLDKFRNQAVQLNSVSEAKLFGVKAKLS